MAKRFSNLDLMKEVDAFPYEDTEPEAFQTLTSALYTLTWKDGQPLGYMLGSVVEELLRLPEVIRGPVAIDNAARTVHAFEHGATEAERTRTVAAVMDYWRARGTFAALRGWRDELWPVYAAVGSGSGGGSGGGGDGTSLEVLYSVERSGMGLLGTMRYGVHMMAWVRDEAAPHGLLLWVPRRAADKSNFPGMLDNTVAGGLMTGEDPFECVVREADEEADMPGHMVRARTRFTGTVTYIYITDERAGGECGLIYPETQWVYEIKLPGEFTPTPKDGEAEGFRLMTVDEVREELARGSFKPNCALVVLDFLVRHGILTRENEPDYDEIVRRMHRKVAFPGPHQTAS
ncbi:hypothetical protein DL764_005733 [Monosporascus ibericus]|uniref:Nudix hydrolase domain-containing protein n=1 Tax=Monosporascus ibericus TaxID=155417 RepID=A0A4Q4TBE2_9PEZI|nr:hypothetical protein DL764_005733 [Monosporascus ibericus]